jgi:hypothetical protein
MARKASFLEDNLTMIAMAAIAVGFVLYSRRGAPGATINGLVGTSRPPPRPRDRARDAVFAEWLRAQQSKGNLQR